MLYLIQIFYTMKKENYVAPELEQLQVTVEGGIATSPGDDNTGSFDGEWVPIG